MNNVYVSQMKHRRISDQLIPVVDISPALKYGAIQILLEQPGITLTPVPMVRQLQDGLADFSDDDYLLPLGDPIAMAAAMAIAAKNNNGRVKVLHWTKGDYAVLQLEM